MNIFSIIKELYTGKENLVAQLGIFALAGIMSISFNQIISIFTGNTLYAIFAPPSDIEAIIFSLTGIMISVYFIGYMYQFVHESYNQQYAELPSISMNCFTTFIKMFPIIFVWTLYVLIALYASSFILMNRIEFYVFVIFLMIIIPFVNMVTLLFSKDFHYESEFFNPIIIAKLMNKTFSYVFKLLIQYLLLVIIIASLSGVLFNYLIINCSGILRMLFILLILCLSSYVQQILNLAYYCGLVKIIKKFNI